MIIPQIVSVPIRRVVVVTTKQDVCPFSHPQTPHWKWITRTRSELRRPRIIAIPSPLEATYQHQYDPSSTVGNKRKRITTTHAAQSVLLFVAAFSNGELLSRFDSDRDSATSSRVEAAAISSDNDESDSESLSLHPTTSTATPLFHAFCVFRRLSCFFSRFTAALF